MLTSSVTTAASFQPKYWIDADTGNEMDDLYALFRVLSESALDIAGISSAHFNNSDLIAFDKWNQYPTRDINTVQISQDLNQALLVAMNRQSIPHPLGADRQMGRAWGGREPRDSAAAQGIIAAANSLGRDEKLIVINVGALTNIASALALEPSIASNLIVYLLGTQYDFSTKAWNKNDFNIRNDPNAFDFLLDHPTLEMVVMPVNTVSAYQYEKEETLKSLSDSVAAEKMLKQRWEETNPQDNWRILWDVALVQAVINPSLANLEAGVTPPENTPKAVRIYTRIDVTRMKEDFWAAVSRNRFSQNSTLP